ncbi:MAG: succinylglutamate desuccinylase/aspartoacylase family protein [Alphaproteobacteria bacterium]|nr:succinylglutamate desuccinylase/aspartoacylase family protein [Alphaproteobacteria bacterium]
MQQETLRFPLPRMSIGTSRELVVFRYGRPGARPKAYLQAALHADELPGQLVLRELRVRLDHLAATGRIAGEIVLVPVANPVGLSQIFGGRHIGRHEGASGENFNRNFPDLGAVADKVEGSLGPDRQRNVGIVRAALRAHLDGLACPDELSALRRLLLSLSCDADIALDLHCDEDAAMHLYTGDLLWPQAADLAADLGAVAVLLARVSGGHPFDEALSATFAMLSERFGAERPVPADACLSATLELRGQADVDAQLAARDADGLVRFLTRRGVVAGTAPAPASAGPPATPLSGVDVVRAPAAGLVLHHVAVGERVAPGQMVAEIVDPLAEPARQPGIPVLSRTSGILFARSRERLARPGQPIAKVAGPDPLPDRTGHLLID